MTYWNAALLGLVQGLAEFLPISSSGHLAVLQNFLAIGDMENHMLFDVLLHLGTLAAVILAFWKDVREVVTEFLRMLHLRRTPSGWAIRSSPSASRRQSSTSHGVRPSRAMSWSWTGA